MFAALVAFINAIMPYILQVGIAAGKLARYAFFALLAAMVLRAFGLLPRSPFRALNGFLQDHPEEWFRAVMVFLPVPEMLALLNAWAACMLLWLVFKLLYSVFKPS